MDDTESLGSVVVVGLLVTSVAPRGPPWLLVVNRAIQGRPCYGRHQTHLYTYERKPMQSLAWSHERHAPPEVTRSHGRPRGDLLLPRLPRLPITTTTTTSYYYGGK